MLIPLDNQTGRFTLRPYQVEAVDAVYREWRDSPVATMVVKATGLGKTVVFSEVILRWPIECGRALVIAHRQELIDQAADKIERHTGVPCDVEMGTNRVSRNHMFAGSPVIVSSVQTQNSGRTCIECRGEGCENCMDGRRYRMCKFKPADIGLVIIDEGHHAAAATYRRMLKWYRRNPDLRILMVTATPKRHDNIGMHNVVDTVAFQMGIQEAIDEGWLVPIRQRLVHIDGLDFSWCRTKAGGDLQDGQVEHVMLGGGDDAEKERMLHEVVSPTLQEANGRQALVFAAGKEHARLLTDVFCRHPGVTAECVIDSTPRELRKEYVEGFREGRINVLVGVGVFLEGFDAPATSVIAVARPTSSESLYTQIIGRGTRPLEGIVDGPETPMLRQSAIAHSAKPYVTILDFVGNSGRHKLVTCADVLSGDDVNEADLDWVKANAGDEPFDVQDALKQAKERREQLEEMERKRQARFEEQQQREAAERQGELEQERERLLGHATYSTESVDPFGVSAVPEVATGKVRGPKCSTGQREFLERLGVSSDVASGFTRRQASAVINKLLNQRGAKHIISFGKYQGRTVSQVPRHYLQWMQQNLTRSDRTADLLNSVSSYLRGECDA